MLVAVRLTDGRFSLRVPSLESFHFPTLKHIENHSLLHGHLGVELSSIPPSLIDG
jgi:hypothetical protein